MAARLGPVGRGGDVPSRPGGVRDQEGRDPQRLQEMARIVADRVRLARWGEDRPGRTTARQPEQPRSGPGGAAYPHARVRHSIRGQGGAACWLFEPADPAPRTAPLIVFFHGWGGNDPAGFGAWIDHLVKRGNVVVFPVYQESLRTPVRTPATQMLTNSIGAISDAIRHQQAEGGVRLDLGRVAALGHSLGGTLCVQLAAVAAQHGLPVPKALMPVAPGRGGEGTGRFPWIGLASVPAETLLLCVAGEDDHNAGDRIAKAIFTSVPQIPTRHRNLVILRSDDHGTPPLVANHRSPGASNITYRAPRDDIRLREPMEMLVSRDFPPVDAMDYYGYWKLFDGLTDAAFYGRNRVYALGDTVQQRSMGVWSDGTPVREPSVIVDPRMLAP